MGCRCDSSWQESHGRRAMASGAGDSWSCCTHSQEAGGMNALFSACCLLFIHSRAYRMAPPTFRACLPTSNNPLYKLPHRDAQRFVSWANLDCVKLTISTSQWQVGRSGTLHHRQALQCLRTIRVVRTGRSRFRRWS